jgi:hypothetical protein
MVPPLLISQCGNGPDQENSLESRQDAAVSSLSERKPADPQRCSHASGGGNSSTCKFDTRMKFAVSITRIIILLSYTAIGFSPGGSSPYTSTHNTNGKLQNSTYSKYSANNEVRHWRRA